MEDESSAGEGFEGLENGEAIRPGVVVAGYRIDSLLSRGGMGIVYCATNRVLDQRYALKVIAPELASDPSFLERFRREIRLAASLRHPHAIEVHYAGEAYGQPFLVMDFVDGTDLREVIVKEGAIDLGRAVELLTQVSGALDAAHRMGLVHRDLKPANVLIGNSDGEEHAFLTDFGLAKRLESHSDFTRTGLVVGTVDYMAPEQITGGHVDARADIYGLGCVLFHMLSGEVPFGRDNTAATMWAQVYDPRPSLTAVRDNVHPAFDEVIAKAMAKDPDERYVSAGDFARDAAAALAGARYTGPPTVVARGEARPPGIPADSTAGANTVASPARVGGASGVGARDADEPCEAAMVAERAGTGVGVATSPAAGPPFVVPSPDPAPRTATGSRFRGRTAAVLGVLVLGVGVAAAVLLTNGSSEPGRRGGVASGGFSSRLGPVPTNHVTGAGSATVRLAGDVATVTVNADRLLDARHLMHIHAGALGLCPDASAARRHNGYLAISTSNGLRWYGEPVTALTTNGDTSPNSKLAFPRTVAGSRFRYSRTFRLDAPTAQYIKEGNAVVVVHGIDYNDNTIYDGILDRSELDPTILGEATAPALCGPLVPQQPQNAAVDDVYAAALTPATNAKAFLCRLPHAVIGGPRPA